MNELSFLGLGAGIGFAAGVSPGQVLTARAHTESAQPTTISLIWICGARSV